MISFNEIKIRKELIGIFKNATVQDIGILKHIHIQEIQLIKLHILILEKQRLRKYCLLQNSL